MADAKASNSTVEGDLETASNGSDRRSTHIERMDIIHRSLSFSDIYQPPINKPKEYPTLQTWMLAYQALGVVYGDLGTSPVNTFSSTAITNLNEDDLVGVLSLIFWTMTLLCLVKYVFIVLHANDHGEGGTFALYSIIRRHISFHSRLTFQNTRLESVGNLTSYRPQGSSLRSKTKKFLERSTVAQNLLTFVVLLGTCMVIGDGALTPATSGKLPVLSPAHTHTHAYYLYIYRFYETVTLRC
ncbi:unnamed protein product [Ilex paraguariensis]|uniref:K+ potassium transporter integral membrane domain-containing protein n=1 Tax=Ilex paraguariensis TaxID=185542 RepID=A0ABC8TCZ3_9AQUA